MDITEDTLEPKYSNVGKMVGIRKHLKQSEAMVKYKTTKISNLEKDTENIQVDRNNEINEELN